MLSHSLEKDLRQPLLPRLVSECPNQVSKSQFQTYFHILLVIAGLNLTILFGSTLYSTISPISLTSHSLESCAWPILQKHTSLLNVPPITQEEYLSRQSILAKALQDAGVDAFIAEPSASTAYYANLSTFSLSERPFLLLFSSSGQFSYLAPKFELNRIARLPMVFAHKKVIEWREEESPYEVLRQETTWAKVMVDEHARFMIASGLQGVGMEVVPMSREVQSLRAVKSSSEIAILKGINAFTLQLVRSLQKCTKVGMTQDTIMKGARELFSRAGVGEGFWAIILFGEQAANPHGGGEGKTLEDGEFLLMDIGSNLHSYGSDVTRTFLPPNSKVSEELMEVWNTVHAAQGVAIELMKANETCSVVDAASRAVIEEKGYGEFFTHRLGHGLGLEMHEHPYLNGANKEKLKIGEVVTNEPGIYVTSEQAKKMSRDEGFGVRIEDAVLVTEDGGVVLTGARAQSPYEP